jgi:hypothetical protein
LFLEVGFLIQWTGASDVILTLPIALNCGQFGRFCFVCIRTAISFEKPGCNSSLSENGDGLARTLLSSGPKKQKGQKNEGETVV